MSMHRVTHTALILGVLAALMLSSDVVAQTTPQAAPVSSHWHDPTDHEHGGVEPQWLVDMFLLHPQLQALFGADSSGHLSYTVPFNTSAAENNTLPSPDGIVRGKHWAMKGFPLTYNADPAKGFQGVDGSWLDGYARVHLSGTPVDRGAMKHSAQVFIAGLNNAGQPDLLAIRQGWINTGAVDDDTRIPNFCPETPSPRADVRALCADFNPSMRPRVMVVTADSLTGKYSADGRPNYQEQWYPRGIGFDWGWGISDAPSMAQNGEKLDDYDFTKWGLIRGTNGAQALGLVRQIDLSAKAQPYHNALFWTNQDGEGVNDPNGLECQAPNICVLNYYNDFHGIKGRSPVQEFPGRSTVHIPN